MSNKNLLFLFAAILGLVLGYTLAQAKRYDEMTKILKEANDKLEATRKEFKSKKMNTTINNIIIIMNRRNMRRNGKVLSKLSS